MTPYKCSLAPIRPIFHQLEISHARFASFRSRRSSAVAEGLVGRFRRHRRGASIRVQGPRPEALAAIAAPAGHYRHRSKLQSSRRTPNSSPSRSTPFCNLSITGYPLYPSAASPPSRPWPSSSSPALSILLFRLFGLRREPKLSVRVLQHLSRIFR
ncbi:uncharacterized protein [Triticum aestivum]|uniref:uncharacterized protein n=1 Tax=Triticum aestivum TaxID=4565 RepID=UPI001D033691|nr:uncharacterized protein LOC123162772 [Triticum aestivum]